MLKDEPGLMTGVSHEINMGELKPCRTMPYRICPAWREAIKDEISTLFFKKGIIEPSNSPWSSPIFSVHKSDGSVHLYIDFRKLNVLTAPDSYCIPLVEDR